MMNKEEILQKLTEQWIEYLESGELLKAAKTAEEIRKIIKGE